MIFRVTQGYEDRHFVVSTDVQSCLFFSPSLCCLLDPISEGGGEGGGGSFSNVVMS